MLYSGTYHYTTLETMHLQREKHVIFKQSLLGAAMQLYLLAQGLWVPIAGYPLIGTLQVDNLYCGF